MSVRPHPKQFSPNPETRKRYQNAWIIDCYPFGANGKRYQRIFWGPHRKAIEKEQHHMRHAKGTHSTNPKINEVLPQYLEWYKMYRSPRTYEDLLGTVKHITPVFGHLPINLITRDDVRLYIERRREFSLRIRAERKENNTGGRQTGAISNRTIMKELNYFKGLVRWMVDNDMCASTGLNFKIQQLPYTKPLPDPPSPDDVEKMLKEIDNPIKKSLIILMYESGVRWSEAATLRWENIKWEKGVAVVTAKGNKFRAIIFPNRVKELLEPFKKKKGFTFVNPRTKKPFTTLKKVLDNACTKAKVRRITPHQLRHAFATDTLAATGDLRLVQTLMGHNSIETTTIYTTIVAERYQEAKKNVDHYRRDSVVVDNK